jgi:L-threonylcarbamoyladenylate synthase
LVLPKSHRIPDIVTSGGPTVGVRWPSHPFMLEVIRACGFPLAAPSANPANELSPTNAQHVAQKLGSKLRLIVDGGQSQVGIESTVLDLTVHPPRILRPGIIHEESLAAALGDTLPSAQPPSPPPKEERAGVRGTATSANPQLSIPAEGSIPSGSSDPSASSGSGESLPSNILRSPGLLARHYAPRAKVLVLGWRSDSDLEHQLQARMLSPAQAHVIAHSNVPLGGNFARVCLIPHDPEAYARAIYSELHRCDDEGAQLIVLERVPEGPEWRGIADRLQRASASPIEP